MRGFGTHNGWLAFGGWLGAKIYGAQVSWTVSRSPYQHPWHVITIGDDDQ